MGAVCISGLRTPVRRSTVKSVCGHGGRVQNANVSEMFFCNLTFTNILNVKSLTLHRKQGHFSHWMQPSKSSSLFFWGGGCGLNC